MVNSWTLRYLAWILSIHTIQCLVVMSPNTLHYGWEEIVHVTGSRGSVQVQLQDYNSRQTFYTSEAKPSNADNNPLKITVTVEYDDVTDLDLPFGQRGHYAYLVVTEDGTKKAETVVNLSEDVARVRVETDKPIYLAGEEVHLSAFVTDLNGKPIDIPLRVDVESPSGTITDRQEGRDFHSICTDVKLTDVVGCFQYSFAATYPKGVWTAKVYYGPVSNDKRRFSSFKAVKFQIDEYEVPPFECRLSGLPEVIVLGDRNTVLEHSVKAIYTYGKPVSGDVVVHYGVDGLKFPFYFLSDHGGLKDGRRTVSVNLINMYTLLEDVYPTFKFEGKHLLIKAICTEDASGKKVHVEDKNDAIPFVTSAYKINFDENPTSFVPGLKHPIRIQLQHANGKPAANERVKIEQVGVNSEVIKRTDSTGRVLIFAYPENTIQLKVHHVNSETEATQIIRKSTSTGVTVFSPKLEFDTEISMEFEVHYKNDVDDLTLYVVSKGRVMRSTAVTKTATTYSTVYLKMEDRMTPSVDVIVVYKYGGRYQITHPWRVFGKVECAGKWNQEDTEYPGVGGSLEVLLSDFEPKSHIHLSVIDTALENMKLSLNDNTDDCEVESDDELEKLGVAVAGGTFRVTSQPPAPQCPAKRKRRNAVTGAAHDARECCAEGETFENDQCSLNALKYVLENDVSEGCFEAFEGCCTNFTHDVGRPRAEMHRARITTAELYEIKQKFTDITVRSNFQHSVMPVLIPTSYTGDARTKMSLPDSMTSWKFSPVSILDGRICRAKPFHVTIFNDVFLRLHVPQTAKRGEFVMVEATVFNYKDHDLEVELYMKGDDELCFNHVGEGNNGEAYTSAVRRKAYAEEAISVSWPVIPYGRGEIAEVTVMLAERAFDAEGTEATEGKATIGRVYDIVRKTIRIKDAGIEQSYRKIIQVNPAEHNNDCVRVSAERQTCSLDFPLPHSFVAGSARVMVHVYPVVFGEAVKYVQEFNALKRGLSFQSGTAGAIIDSMGLAVYALVYLRESGGSLEGSSIVSVIGSGISAINDYRNSHGGISVWRFSTNTNTWLTASALKVFSQADRVESGVDDALLRGCVDYLYSKQVKRGEDLGSFTEAFYSPQTHRTLLTAHVMIALMEANIDTEEHAAERSDAINYLYNSLFEVESAYTVAMVAYALSSSQYSTEAYHTLKAYASEDEMQGSTVRHFGDSKHTLETEAYAILTALAHEDVVYCHPIVNFLLLKHRGDNSLYHNNKRANAIVLQALAEYEKVTERTPIDVKVEVSRDGIKVLQRWSIKESDKGRQFTYDPEDDELDAEKNFSVIVNVEGTGEIQLELEGFYNVRNQDTAECPFELNVTNVLDHDKNVFTLNKIGGVIYEEDDYDDYFGGGGLPFDLPFEDDEYYELFDNNLPFFDEPELPEEEEHTPDSPPFPIRMMSINTCVRYTGDFALDLAVLEVQLVTGYHPYEIYLKKLVEHNVISNYAAGDDIITLYIENVLPYSSKCIKLWVVQTEKAFQVSPGAVTVYDYNNPASRCTKRYRVDTEWPPLYRGDRCYEGACTTCRGGRHGSWTLKKFKQEKCSSHAIYAILAKYIKMERVGEVLQYHVEVKSQYKQGDFNFEGFGKTVVLEVADVCECPTFNTTDVGKIFLVMGDHESYVDEKYVLQMNQHTYLDNWYEMERTTRRDFAKQLRKACNH